MAGFRDLEVWKRVHELALEVYRLARGFSPDERFRFTDQLCRASTSVPTNIAEGTSERRLRRTSGTGPDATEP